MNGYKDDEFCIFCGEDLIYLNQYGWFCPNHNSTVLLTHKKALNSYSTQIRIIKNGLAIINQSNSLKPQLNKTMWIEFSPLIQESLKYHKIIIENCAGKIYLNKLLYKNLSYISNSYNIIFELPNSNVKLFPDDFDKNLEKIKKLLPFI